MFKEKCKKKKLKLICVSVLFTVVMAGFITHDVVKYNNDRMEKTILNGELTNCFS